MENKQPNWAEEILAKFSLKDKIIAAGIITFQYDFFDKKQEELTGSEIANIDNIVRKHIYANGEMGVKMAVQVGKAMKASIQNPLKPKFSLGSYFKAKIKAALS